MGLKATMTPADQALYDASLLNAQQKTMELARVLQRAAFHRRGEQEFKGEIDPPAPLYMFQAQAIHASEQLRIDLKAVIHV